MVGNAKANTFEKTNYLKGIAVVAVWTNHFINRYMDVPLAGYANGIIAFFFLLSGYGIYLSLQKQVAQKGKIDLVSFYKKRLVRIYPLFWIWCILAGFSNGLLGFFGLDFIDPVSPWFVPAIIQCYLLAPLLFSIQRRFNKVYTLPLLVLLVLVVVTIGTSLLGIEPIRTVAFKDMFVLHILLFALGYTLAQLQDQREYPKYMLFVTLVLFVFLLHETTPQQFIQFTAKAYIFPLLFAFVSFALVLVFLNCQFQLPLRKVFAFTGIHSYSIYLFHGKGFGLLEKVGLIQPASSIVWITFIWVVTLPVFILGLAALETLVHEFVFGKRSIKNAYSSYMDKLPLNINRNAD